MGDIKTAYCPICDKEITFYSEESYDYCPECGHHLVPVDDVI